MMLRTGRRIVRRAGFRDFHPHAARRRALKVSLP
ncbi:hypothetical protein GGR25_004951 [Kaistia hirudinis]|uniref:Uncharacterized protein n=1 Tax=Kaistia hirudinis TaxID=1293440 RepID=A0A840AYK9_9HYPH|nr:hypothetical protein [Kaistia hirudinis]